MREKTDTWDPASQAAKPPWRKEEGILLLAKFRNDTIVERLLPGWQNTILWEVFYFGKVFAVGESGTRTRCDGIVPPKKLVD